MIKKLFIITSIAILVLAFNTQTFSQDKPQRIKLELLKSLIDKTDHILMLKIKDGQIIALNSNRKAIHPLGYTAPHDEVFYVYEVSDLKKSIDKPEKLDLKTKDIKGGSFGDEYVALKSLVFACPPDCP